MEQHHDRRKVGRPRAGATGEQVRLLRAQGLSFQQVAASLHIGKTTAWRRLAGTDSGLNAFQKAGNPFQNPSQCRTGPDSHPARRNATDAPLTAGPECDGPGMHQPGSPDPVRAVVRLRRVRPVSATPIQPDKSRAPGRCLKCGSLAWRNTPSGPVCTVCHPLD